MMQAIGRAVVFGGEFRVAFHRLVVGEVQPAAVPVEVDAAEALQNIGADVMRFMFSEQVPSQNLKFGYGPAGETVSTTVTFPSIVAVFETVLRQEQEVSAAIRALVGQLRTVEEQQLVVKTDAIVAGVAFGRDAARGGRREGRGPRGRDGGRLNILQLIAGLSRLK